MSNRYRSLFLIGIAAVSSVAAAQGGPADWFLNCYDPTVTPNPSPDFLINVVQNQLMIGVAGGGGDWKVGNDPGQGGACFFPPAPGAITVPAQGKFAMSYGPVASIQKYSPNFSSASMTLNFGGGSHYFAPGYPGGAYVNLIIDGTQVFFGQKPVLFFKGFSNRYLFYIDDEGSVRTRLQLELVADALRYRWQVTNNDTASHKVGLWFGSSVNMLLDNPNQNGSNVSNTNFTAAGFATQQNGPDNFGNRYKGIYVFLPNLRPPDTDVSFDRTVNAQTFPDFADFVFGQTDAFGMRILNDATPATADIPANEPTRATGMDIGKSFFLLGPYTDNAPIMPDTIISDTEFLTEPGFIQKFPSVTIPAGATNQFLNYVVSSWGNGNYALPYGAVVDAPHIVQTNPVTAQLQPNPMTIRVWVDNVGGFAFDQHEFQLNDVAITLKFLQPGLTITSTGGAVQRINAIDPRQDAFRDFTVVADQNVAGPIDYVVTLDSEPGDVHKEIDGTIVVASRPRTTLVPGANMISDPFNQVDNSWQAVLANFKDQNGQVPQTFTWNPQRQEYEVSLTAEKGKGAWAIFTANQATTQDFSGQPTPPSTAQTPAVQLYPGWNMIANPFNYPFPINQINGVAATDPQHVHTFSELVSLGYISPYVATWDPVAKTYVYIDATSGALAPNTAYWVNVIIESSLTIAYPPLFVEGVPGAVRKTGKTAPPAGAWQLQLSARHNLGASDLQNYVGTASTQAQANRLTMLKAPMAPRQPIQLGIVQNQNNKPKLMTRAYLPTQTSYSWKVAVDVTKPGQVMLTWPNITSVPSNLQVLLKDENGGTVANLRTQTSYAFNALAPGRRQFTLTIGKMEPTIVESVGITPRPTYGFTTYSVNYELRKAAVTTTKIYGSAGTLIAILHSNRSDAAGTATDYWNRRDTSGRIVGSGTYTAVVSATGSDGYVDSKSVDFPVR